MKGEKTENEPMNKCKMFFNSRYEQPDVITTKLKKVVDGKKEIVSVKTMTDFTREITFQSTIRVTFAFSTSTNSDIFNINFGYFERLYNFFFFHLICIT